MLKVELISKNKGKVDYFPSVRSILCRTSWGYEEILPGHTSFISLLQQGVLGVDGDFELKYFALGEGILKIENDFVLILSEKIITEQEIISTDFNLKPTEDSIVSDSQDADVVVQEQNEWNKVLIELKKQIQNK